MLEVYHHTFNVSRTLQEKLKLLFAPPKLIQTLLTSEQTNLKINRPLVCIKDYPNRKITKKFTKEFDSKVINRQYFHRKTKLNHYANTFLINKLAPLCKNLAHG